MHADYLVTLERESARYESGVAARRRIGEIVRSLLVWATLGWLLIPTTAEALFYRPPQGILKDNHVIWHDGTYYMFSMYWTKEPYNNMWLATSPDGVHWNDVGPVIAEYKHRVLKMFVYKGKDTFLLNFGSFSDRPGFGNDTLSFWESKDLVHWRHTHDNHPDPRWYNETGRWDHMYVIPKVEDSPEKGYWGYVVATPLDTLPYRSICGLLQSSEGARWEVLPPPQVEWGDIEPKFFETGGCERIGNKYYFIGGTGSYMGNYGYANYTFVSQSPTGPFRPDVKAFRLCGTSGKSGCGLCSLVHACFSRGNNELLICNYMANPLGSTLPPPHEHSVFWMPPLKKAVVDQQGHLRMGYWRGNEAVKGELMPIDIQRTKQIFPAAERQPNDSKEKPLTGKLPTEKLPTGASISVSDNRLVITSDQVGGARFPTRWAWMDWYCGALLDSRFDVDKGIVLEGKISAHIRHRDLPKCVGFYIEERPGRGTAIFLEIGGPEWRRARIGTMTYGDRVHFETEDVSGPRTAAATGMEEGEAVHFRLLIRKNMLELYADDLLVQGWTMQQIPSGRVGLVVRNAIGTFEALKVWEMNFD